jgi:hypothetical protein
MNIESALEILIESLRKSETDGFEFLKSCLDNIRSSDSGNHRKALESLSTCYAMSVWAGFDCQQSDLLSRIAIMAEERLNN